MAFFQKIKSGMDELAEQAQSLLSRRVDTLSATARLGQQQRQAALERLPGGKQTTLGHFGPELLRTAGGIVQETARSVASAGLTVSGAFGGSREQVIPKQGVSGFVGRTVFGQPNTPLKAIETRIAEGELSARDFGRAVKLGNIELPLIGRERAKVVGARIEQSALPISIIGVGGMIFADFTPFGGRSSIAKQLAKIDDVDNVIDLLRKSGLPRNTIEEVAPKIANTKSPQAIDTLLRVAKKKYDASIGSGIVPSRSGLAPDATELGVRTSSPALPRSAELPEPMNSELLRSLPNDSTARSEYDSYRKAQSGIKGAWLTVREMVQDNFIRVRKLQESVTNGARIPDDINIDQAQTLFAGRVHTRLEAARDVAVKIDQDVVATAKQLSTQSDQLTQEVHSFLHARHALERNSHLYDGAAGMTNKQADEVLLSLESSPHKEEVYRLGKSITDLNKETLQVLLDAQVIDRELFTLLNQTYKHHVPLQRIVATSDDLADVISGPVPDAVRKSKGIKRAAGSKLQVADILTNVVANLEQAIVRAEKNMVDLATLRFARKYEELGLFSEIKSTEIGTTFSGRPIYQQINDPLVLKVFENGKAVYVRINDKRLAVALQGVNVEHVPGLLKGIATITRIYAGLHTRFNYEFAFSNGVRDIQEMMVDIASRKDMGFGAAAHALKKDPQSKKAVFDYLRGKDTPGANLYRQMKADGGSTGGISLSTREHVTLEIEKIRTLNRSKPRQAAAKAIELVDKWNNLFEDSTRLSVYRTALERGLSRNNAAVLAKQATLDFNRKGTAGPLINGMFMFSNASIQGTTKMLRAMKNPKVAAAVTGTLGAAVYAANNWNDSVDESWRDKVTKWDRSSNLVVMLPGEETRYLTIPISWGLKPIKVSMEYMYDASTGHGDLADATHGVLAAIFEAYNPLSGDEDVLNTLTPTIAKVPVEIARNRAWYGSAIKPDYDPNVPASSKYFKSLENTFLGKAAITATEKLSESTGIELSPADVNYAFNQYIGGAGKSVLKITQAITAIDPNRELAAKDRPILSRFLKERDEEEVLRDLYYSEKERNDKAKAEKKVQNVRRVTPIYETAQMLMREGRESEAVAIVDNLSEDDYEIYKTMRASDKRRETAKGQIEMFKMVKTVQGLIEQGDYDAAQDMVDDMEEDEYKLYQSVKKQLGIESPDVVITEE